MAGTGIPGTRAARNVSGILAADNVPRNRNRPDIDVRSFCYRCGFYCGRFVGIALYIFNNARSYSDNMGLGKQCRKAFTFYCTHRHCMTCLYDAKTPRKVSCWSRRQFPAVNPQQIRHLPARKGPRKHFARKSEGINILRHGSSTLNSQTCERLRNFH